jgi:hypothetical protein
MAKKLDQKGSFGRESDNSSHPQPQGLIWKYIQMVMSEYLNQSVCL